MADIQIFPSYVKSGTLDETLISTVDNAIKRSKDDSSLELYGGSNYNNGASVILNGYNNDSGSIVLRAKASSTSNTFKVNSDGSATIGGNDIVHNNYASEITMTNYGAMKRNVDNSYMRFCGGSSWDNGAALVVEGKSSNNGRFIIKADNGSAEKQLIGTPTSLKWDGIDVSLHQRLVSSGSGEIAQNTNKALCYYDLSAGTWILIGHARIYTTATPTDDFKVVWFDDKTTGNWYWNDSASSSRGGGDTFLQVHAVRVLTASTRTYLMANCNTACKSEFAGFVAIRVL